MVETAEIHPRTSGTSCRDGEGPGRPGPDHYRRLAGRGPAGPAGAGNILGERTPGAHRPHPSDREPLTIAAGKAVRFKPGKALKEAVR